MTTTETSPARKSLQAASKHIRVDAQFARLLADDLGIAKGVILDALVSEPQKQAVAICSWASRREDPARALTSWARKHTKGRCHRARRAPDGPSRRHEEISPRRSVDTDDDGRAQRGREEARRGLREGRTPRPCMCSCGGTTKGGRFLPGHDQVLYARIKRQLRSDPLLRSDKFTDEQRRYAVERGLAGPKILSAVEHDV